MSRTAVTLVIKQLISKKLPKKELNDLLDYYDWIMDGLERAAKLRSDEMESVAIYRTEE